MSYKALIIGLGISGMSSAIELRKKGWTVTVIERSQSRRTGGYFIGLREDGKDAARKLGALQYMPNRTPNKSQFWDVAEDGSRKAIRDITNETNAPVALIRGDIEEALWTVLGDDVEVKFNTVPVSIINNPESVSVTMRTGDSDDHTGIYDLVVGADGVRSSVRRMVFGSDDEFLDPVGTSLFAFPLSAQLKGFGQGDGILMAKEGRSLTVFPLSDIPPTALFSFRNKVHPQSGENLSAEGLRKIFGSLDYDGIISSVLGELSGTQDYVFDSVNMVKMPKWSKGRVVLVGDAAWCLTLYSGMGASAGMIGGVALGESIGACGNDIHSGLEEFEKIVRPFVKKNQRFIRLRSELFVPSSKFTVWIRHLLWAVLTKTVAR